jgi:endo-1,4-beta-xylanase
MAELEKMTARFFNKHLKPGPALVQPDRPERRRRGRAGTVTEGPIAWVYLPDELPPGVKHETFHSKSMNTDVGYLIYLPPDYASGNKRYPVVYWLHGLNGTEAKFPALTQKLAKSIADKKVPPMIMVLPNGGQRTFYCDSVDGKIMSETAIIKELIPHIDANYRTIASREGRALEGFSMGGFGAVHLAFKYPEMFSSMAAGAAALFDLEHFSSGHSEFYKTMFNEDPEVFKAEDPFELARKNAERIRGKLQVMLFVGTEDRMYRYNEKFSALLDELKIPYEYLKLEGVGHNRIACYEAFFDRIMAFHLKALSPPVDSQPALGPTEKGNPPIIWVNPPAEKLPGVEHHTFYSAAMQCDVGFNIYLPPDYKSQTKRYPVLYYLHGLTGDESKHIRLSAHLDKAIAEKKIPPMLMVFVNGGKGTMYSDSVDGKILPETAIITELIPFVDKNCRTISSREGRAIEGFSMGGFGALKLAFQHTDIFCSVISYGGALHDLESFSTRRQERYEQIFGGKPQNFQANSPYELARKNANEIRQNLQIRMVVGSEDQTLSFNKKMRSLLDELEIPYEWELVEGVGHRIFRYYEEVGVKGLQFHCRRLCSEKPPTTNHR